MSVDFRIVARSEAAAVAGDPGHYRPASVLCSLGDLLDFFAAKEARVDAYRSHYSIATSGGNDGAEVRITREAGGGITQISFNVYGEHFDRTLIGECAARFGGIVFDHQSSEMLTADAFLRRRCR
jgi:hypothetical protein